jgi:hypothetical protein
VIIFGFRSRAATLAMLNLACRNGHVAAHRLVKVTRWFTLFFIPVIPFNRTYRTVCAQCGTQVKWSKADADTAVAHAPSTNSATSMDPVAEPLPSSWQVAPLIAPSEPRVASGPPADWYPDPNGTAGQRYWDGSAWTEDLRQT